MTIGNQPSCLQKIKPRVKKQCKWSTELSVTTENIVFNLLLNLIPTKLIHFLQSKLWPIIIQSSIQQANTILHLCYTHRKIIFCHQAIKINQYQTLALYKTGFTVHCKYKVHTQYSTFMQHFHSTIRILNSLL